MNCSPYFSAMFHPFRSLSSSFEIEGGVHFAGEHTSINFQGYMEGAAETGRRAALEVIRRTAS